MSEALLQTLQKQQVRAGLIVECPLRVLDELRQLLVQSKKTKILFCLYSLESGAKFHLQCDAKAIVVDAEPKT